MAENTVLLVEDNPDLGRMLEAVLTRAGFCVLRASKGSEALQFCSPQQDRGIAIALIDMTLPGGLQGDALARQVQAESPRTRIILMSGGLAPANAAAFEFLHKPFQLAELLARMQSPALQHRPETAAQAPDR